MLRRSDGGAPDREMSTMAGARSGKSEAAAALKEKNMADDEMLQQLGNDRLPPGFDKISPYLTIQVGGREGAGATRDSGAGFTSA